LTINWDRLGKVIVNMPPVRAVSMSTTSSSSHRSTVDSMRDRADRMAASYCASLSP
jgi:hypothetical protein